VDFTALAEAVATRVPVPAVVVIPPDGERIAASLDRAGHRHEVAVPITEAAGPGEAARLAAGTTPTGGVVLFSPGAPTPYGEGGFRARSRLFQQAFEALTR
jgi:UDP-N-acetylmuramoylalanine--D-glutamate ligase